MLRPLLDLSDRATVGDRIAPLGRHDYERLERKTGTIVEFRAAGPVTAG
jgi:hypothetical protein